MCRVKDDPWIAPFANSLDSPGVITVIVLLSFLIRAFHPGQPIVENYVGRQVPTAMVARNLERGSTFFRPQLDTAPFPNYFVVEPPVYQSFVVALCRVTGLGLSPSGRIISALFSALAAWGLYDLARRRDSARVALVAVLVFSLFPLTIRYGRAFQPDASMLGATVAGLACWDRSLAYGSVRWLRAAWCLLALGLAIKITSAFLLIPLLFMIARSGRRRQMIAALGTLLPGLLWYIWAHHLIGQGVGSLASADNRSVWLAIMGPSALVRTATLKIVAWSLLVRAFTPLGTVLALVGLSKRTASAVDRPFWSVWGGAALVAMALLAGKLHHEYYWLPLAPVAAVGVARSLDLLLAHGRVLCGIVAGVLVALSVTQARSTWQTPIEWQNLESAGRTVQAVVPADCWVAASEPLLYQSDRRGCRMEWTDRAAARAAGEWGADSPPAQSPLDLIEYYRHRGARYFADIACSDPLAPRKGLHDAIRRRYKVIVDSPDVLIADLSDSGMSLNAN
jgi:4-amino-4-deoxy-L-arabinose transferase-like glycosyltransferase